MPTVTVAEKTIIANIRKRGNGGGQSPILWEDEGTPLGSAGTVTEVDITGSGATATRVGNKVTVNVPGSGVTSLNALTGALSLISSDASISITPSGTTIDLKTATGIRDIRKIAMLRAY